MKTTIDIADDLLLRAKKVARDDRRTLKAIVEEGLRWILAKHDAEKARQRPDFRIKTMTGGGLTDEAQRRGWATILQHASDREST